MSLNKFMHPRNIYKNPPNFKELAILYPDFRKHAKQDITGKVSIDFKDQEALRALTTTLLKKDFGLEVEIPAGRLVPTLPLRLNYLLWIEDLLALFDGGQVVRGIDVGTGASCIYPLLAAKKNGWYMVATETDSESAEAARCNVERNNLQELVKVQLVDQDKVLTAVVENEEKYDFCMCNPPFFKSEDELDQTKKSRTTERPPPHNARTGSVDEVVTPGGEVALITKIMEESVQLRNSVRVYTSMVGVKSNLRPLKDELLKHGITNTTTTEFCQGRTTRWGLAWSFSEQPSLKEACAKPIRKKVKPMMYVVPVTGDPESYTVELICEKVKDLLSKLQIKHKKIKHSENKRVMSICAAQNTWSNQRRLRREMQKMLNSDDDPRGKTSDETFSSVGAQSLDNQKQTELRTETENTDITAASKSAGQRSSESLRNITGRGSSKLDTQWQRQKRGRVEASTELQAPAKKNKTDTSAQSQKNSGTSQVSAVLNASLVVRKEEQNILVEMVYIDGTSGKDGVHQVLQYIRNNLK